MGIIISRIGGYTSAMLLSGFFMSYGLLIFTEMATGWISLHRQLMDNPLYFSEKFTRVQAWIDLLLLANQDEGWFYKRGIRVVVNRGQVGYDLESLAQRWRWSRGKVNRFLNELENDKQIVMQKNNVSTLISIVNYNVYQTNGKAKSIASNTTDGQQTDTNNNNNKEIKENIPPDSKNSPKEKKEKEISAEGAEFVRAFYDYMFRENADIMKGQQENIKGSCDTIRLLIERDGFTLEEIKESIYFAVLDDFWKHQIKSLAPLREKGKNGSTKFVNLRAAYLSKKEKEINI